MREIIIAFDSDDSRSRHAGLEAVELVNVSQHFFRLKKRDETVRMVLDRNRVLASETVELVSGDSPGPLICVTERPFTDNWFSHEEPGCSIITTADWEQGFAPPSLRAYLAYQITQALIVMEANLTEEMVVQVAHQPARGCVNDFCGHKPDIKLGMAAGNMCAECEATLRRYGVSHLALDAIQRILGVVRDEVIGRRRIVDPRLAFVVMRFSANDENANAYEYGIKEGLGDVNLRCERGDDRVQSAQILDQVWTSIERSRFIVAKVDEENLNVYFELGLAMGLSKDVLLVSSRNLQLPTDLRNWECLVYEERNYRQLRQRTSDHFRSNYALD